MLHEIFYYSKDNTNYMIPIIWMFDVDILIGEIKYKLFVTHFIYIIYPQNFDVMKFSRQTDCYHMLFINGWLVCKVGLKAIG